MPKCARLRAKANAFAYLFRMLFCPSVDRSSVCRTGVFEKYYASWKEYTWGTLISGGNFRKFWKFPDTNILWKFLEVPKISHCWIFSKYNFSEVEIFGTSENFHILRQYPGMRSFQNFHKMLVSGNFRNFRKFPLPKISTSRISSNEKFLELPKISIRC